jgi:hypothetical protein
MKAGTGSSVNPQAAQAGLEAAQAAGAGLTDVKLAFVYSSVQYDSAALLEGVAQALPGAAIIGITSFTGVLTQHGYIASDDGFVGIMALAGDDFTVGSAIAAKDGDARSTGRKAALAALDAAGKSASPVDAPDYFYMVAPPGEEELYLKGVSDVIGRAPFFGGSAADNSIAGEWLLFGGDTVIADGVAVAFFYTKAPFANVFTGAYHETDNVGIITKVIGKRTLAEIDGVPAIQKYAQWTGQSADALLGNDLLVATITAPLGVKDRLGELTAIRHPMFGNDDYSMNIGANLAEKTAVIQMAATVDELISSAGEAISKLDERIGRKPAAYLLVNCGGRRAAIGERIDELAASIKAAAGDVPFMTEFTFGEYGFEDDGNNTTGGLMLSFTALG